ncbi:MAG: hypothetical protein ABFC85_07040 [Rectinema sp.]
MKSCKTCKHWQNPEDCDRDYRAKDICNPEDPDTYEPMKNLPFEVRRCASPRLLFSERPVESNGACVVDGSGYWAGLCTGEDFYCSNFEAGT